MILEDLEKHDSNAENGLRSVSEGKVYFGHPKGLTKDMLKVSVKTVCCIEHGAMLCMANWKKGAVWRCPTCNVGAVLVENGK